MIDRRSLPLSALRAFESAGRHLHLGRAGEELGVTHGAVSHQVRALEEKLGVDLFIRANNKLQLTKQGSRLLDAITKGFDTMLDGALNLDSDSLSGKLIIGCTQTAARWISRHICDFQNRYEQIDIYTVEVKPQQATLEHDIDIAICFGKPQSEGRNVETLVSPSVFPVCSPRLLHDKNHGEYTTDLKDIPILDGGLDSWERWFSNTETPLRESKRRITFFNADLALNAARQGYGVALCNHLEAQEDLREGRLVQLFDLTIPDSDTYFLISDKPEKQSLRAKLFQDWIKMALANSYVY